MRPFCKHASASWDSMSPTQESCWRQSCSDRECSDDPLDLFTTELRQISNCFRHSKLPFFSSGRKAVSLAWITTSTWLIWKPVQQCICRACDVHSTVNPSQEGANIKSSLASPGSALSTSLVTSSPAIYLSSSAVHRNISVCWIPEHILVESGHFFSKLSRKC